MSLFLLDLLWCLHSSLFTVLALHHYPTFCQMPPSLWIPHSSSITPHYLLPADRLSPSALFSCICPWPRLLLFSSPSTPASLPYPRWLVDLPYFSNRGCCVAIFILLINHLFPLYQIAFKVVKPFFCFYYFYCICRKWKHKNCTIHNNWVKKKKIKNN